MALTVSLHEFWQAWDLFSDAIWTSVILGATLGAMGIFVVLRRMVFLSAALSQSASLGVTLGFWLHGMWFTAHACEAWPAIGAVGMTLAAVLFLLRKGGHRAGDGLQQNRLALVFLTGAAGTLLVGSRILQEIHDVQSLLFGSAVAVLPEQARVLILVNLLLLGMHILWHRGFVQASFDPDAARVRGIPVVFLDVCLFFGLAIAISLGTRVLGAMPIFAFSLLPALAALVGAKNVAQAMCWAAWIGAASAFVGYLLAYIWALPVGATQTFVAVLAVGLAHVLRGGRQLLSTAWRQCFSWCE